jgi:hypothetical protein
MPHLMKYSPLISINLSVNNSEISYNQFIRACDKNHFTYCRHIRSAYYDYDTFHAITPSLTISQNTKQMLEETA